MKNLKPFLIGILLLCVAQNSFSAFVYSDVPVASKPIKPHTISEQDRLTMQQFVSLTPEQYGTLRGKKLSFFERIEFKAAQRKMKKRLGDEDSYGFNVGGFFLGFFLGPLGVLGAYIFSRDRNFRKWTWYGWLAWIAIVLIIYAAGGGSGY